MWLPPRITLISGMPLPPAYGAKTQVSHAAKDAIHVPVTVYAQRAVVLSPAQALHSGQPSMSELSLQQTLLPSACQTVFATGTLSWKDEKAPTDPPPPIAVAELDVVGPVRADVDHGSDDSASYAHKAEDNPSLARIVHAIEYPARMACSIRINACATFIGPSQSQTRKSANGVMIGYRNGKDQDSMLDRSVDE